MYSSAPSSPANPLPITTPLTIAANSSLDLNGDPQQVASLSDYAPGAGGSIINSLASTPATLTLGALGGSTTFSGTLQGGGALGTLSLAMNGGGTQVLAGSNSFTGGTTVSSGTLTAANNAALGSGPVSVAAAFGQVNFVTRTPTIGALTGNGSVVLAGNGVNPTNLTINSAANSTFSGTISETTPGAILTKTGNANLSLGGVNQYTGGTVISGGTLTVGSGGASGTVGGGAVSVANSAALAFNRSDTVTFAQPISGGGTVIQNGTGTVILPNTNPSFTGPVTVNAGAIQLAHLNALQNNIVAVNAVNGLTFAAAANTAAFNVSGLAGNGSVPLTDTNANPVTLSVGGNNASSTFGGALSGAGTLVKTGNGVLSMGGALTYAGTTMINQGTLQMISGAGALPANASLLGSSVNGYQDFFNTPTLNSAWQFYQARTTRLLPAKAASFTLVQSSSGNYLSVTTGDGDPTHMLYMPAGLNADGTWTVLALVQANTVSDRGGICVGANVGPNASNATHGYNDGINELFRGATTTGNVQYLYDNVNWGPTLPNTYTIGQKYWMQLTISGGSAESAIYWPADGSTPQPAVTSGGTWNSNGGNIAIGYAGITSVSTGNNLNMNVYYELIENSQLPLVSVGGGGVLPTTTTVVVAPGATWDINGTQQNVTGLSGTNSGYGNIKLGSGGGLTLTTTGPNTFGGVISDSIALSGSGNAGSLTVAGNGSLALTGANTFYGPTTVSSGQLTLSHQNALQNSTLTPAGGSVVFDQAVGGNFTVGGLAGSAPLALQDSASNPVTLSAGNNNFNSTYSGVLGGPGSLTKIGAGTLTLSGTANNAGSMKINGGNLAATQLSIGSGPITINGGNLSLSPAITVAPGLNVNIYTPDCNTGPMASVAALSAWTAANPNVLTTTTAGAGGVNFPDVGAGNAFTSIGYTGAANYTVVLTGYIKLPAGTSTLATQSDDGSMLWIDGAGREQQRLPGRDTSLRHGNGSDRRLPSDRDRLLPGRRRGRIDGLFRQRQHRALAAQ